jgi:hypothetical protein
LPFDVTHLPDILLYILEPYNFMPHEERNQSREDSSEDEDEKDEADSDLEKSKILPDEED